MNSTTTRRFRELLEALPEPVQRQAQEPYRLSRENPSQPDLHFKPISPSDPSICSVRVGLHYRAIGVRESDTIVWFWIGSHSAYDREVQRG